MQYSHSCSNVLYVLYVLISVEFFEPMHVVVHVGDVMSRQLYQPIIVYALVITGNRLATKVFIGKLLATRGVWVIIEQVNDERGLRLALKCKLQLWVQSHSQTHPQQGKGSRDWRAHSWFGQLWTRAPTNINLGQDWSIPHMGDSNMNVQQRH